MAQKLTIEYMATTKYSFHSQFTHNPDKLDKDAYGMLKNVREVYRKGNQGDNACSRGSETPWA